MDLSPHRIRELAGDTLAPFVVRVRGLPWPAPVQRLGRSAEQAFARVVDRFPSLGVLGSLLSVPEAPAAAGVHAERVSEKPAERPVLLDLLDELESSEVWEGRQRAAARLGSYEGTRVLDALVRAVRDPTTEVALAAIEALARQSDPRAAAELGEVVRDSAGYLSPSTRAAAISAIAHLRGRDALADVVASIYDMDAEVSVAAIEASAKLDPLASLPRLRTLLEDRSGYFLPIVRRAAATHLERTGMISADLALSLVNSEPDEEVLAILQRAATS